MKKFSHPSSVISSLLISASNLAEYQLLAQADVDVIDLKSPASGPMGMLKQAELEAILTQHLQNQPQTSQLSLALGELQEWPENRPWLEQLSIADFWKIAPRCGKSTSIMQWGDHFKRLVERSSQAYGAGISKWVAVVYADHQNAGTPSINEILDHLTADLAGGILLDTWDKSGAGLLKSYTIEDLKKLHAICRSKGLNFGLAGQLRVEHIVMLSETAEVIGCRGAACVEGVRKNRLCGEKVRELVNRWQDRAGRQQFRSH